ncbi:hypothetical protein NEOLEDRAFT_1178551 [Neolentinus lepideus HHB14362 ss-1]|uniref:Methyltransferase-domain-containing protein n=1 Tax=Neolentinus lepideus HHB14362 ss-1 TaxID=1314782 RepID=A0A165SGM4_9AGAM|nr:hypothetical protein NEOLEDRAFT_1178551 [Neolentinus lepideus HHB14362 ss-1]
MFFYLSFLRPPPVQVPPGPVTITPQIANDLRTELYNDVQDIFYSWCPVSNANQENTYPKDLSGTRPVKLTTWRLSSAYKELSVPPPPGLRDGQLWRLMLTAQVQGNPIISLTGEGLGSLIFPVLSMPILFSSRNMKSKKQDQIERIYRFPVPSQDEQAVMVIREQTSFDLDKKIWDSGIGLSGWIIDVFNDQSALLPLVQDMKAALNRPGFCNFVELGAGTGIVSLVLGALRSVPDSSEQSGTRIFTTDLASAMPPLSQNIESNFQLFSSHNKPEAVVLDWDQDRLPDELHCLSKGIDIILMADVTYNTSSFPSLVRTLSSLVTFSTSKSNAPLILLGYKERDAGERKLWSMVKEIGADFEKVGERHGAGGAPVEVWIGRVTLTSNGQC